MAIEKSMPSEFMVETRDLTRRFGGCAAVEGLNLQVPARAIYGFLGPNGAGKTTTIRLLLGLLKPDHGEINLFGKSLSMQRESILKRTGVVFEKPSLYTHLTAFANINVCRPILGFKPERIREVLEIMKLDKDGHSPVKNYSRGMRQRLSISLAILCEPELLILDEPMNSLDPGGIHDLREVLLYLNRERNTTVIMSSHILAEVMNVATHIGVINSGKMIYQGELSLSHLERVTEIIIRVDRTAEAIRLLKHAGWPIYAYPGEKIMIDADNSADFGELESLLEIEEIAISNVEIRKQSLEDFYLKITSSAS